MLVEMTKRELAKSLAHNMTSNRRFTFYDKRPDVGPNAAPENAYVCSATLIHGIFHYVINNVNGGQPFCYNAGKWSMDEYKQFLKAFECYLDECDCHEKLWLNTDFVEHEEMSDCKFVTQSDFADILWDETNPARTYSFTRREGDSDVFVAKRITLGNSRVMICNNITGEQLWWCDLDKQMMGINILHFKQYLTRNGFSLICMSASE